MPIKAENKHRYGDDWPAFSRFIRFVRASGRCECEGECGRGTHAGRCPNEHGKPAYGTGSKVCLTVAHLAHDPEDRVRVKAMCNACHLAYDHEHHMRNAHQTRRGRKASADLFP